MKQNSSLLARSLALLTVLFIASPSRADFVTINFSAGRLYDSTGNSELPDGTLAILLADTLNNGFGQLHAGNLDIGSFFNGDDQILARGTVLDSFWGQATAGGAVEEQQLGTGLFSQFSTNDALAVVWFSGLDDSSFSLTSGTSYGLFTDELWLTPSAGSTLSLQFFTASRGGSYANELGRASLTAVPEPSTYAALLGLAVLGFAAYRRRSCR